MKFLIQTGRAFYAIALFVYGIQQFYFGTFRDVFFSPYQVHLPGLKILAWLFGFYLIASGVMIFIPGKGKKAALTLGVVFLVLLLGTQITYKLISETNKLYHLGIWTSEFKELALAGGAFIIAWTFGQNEGKRSLLEKFMSYGNVLFFITMTAFGIAHLVYTPYLANTVPKWMANHNFWVILTGVSLISAGIFSILGIRIRIVCLLLSLEIFLWFWMVHLPGTLSFPLSDNRGNLLASAFDALAFSGVSLLTALTIKKQQWVEDIENW